MSRDTACRLGALKLRAFSHERMRRGAPSSATLANLGNNAVLFGFLSCSTWALLGCPRRLASCGLARRAATCVDASTLAHSTVSITRYFADDDRKADTDLLGIRGTAWFLSPTSMVTAEHVATAMELSDQTGNNSRFWRENKQTIDVRILRLAGSHSEKIAVLELRAAFSGAQGLQIRMEPLAPEEQVVSIAYPGSHLRSVGGRFVKYGDSDKLAGTALLEMYDGTTVSCSITALPAHRCSIARAAWLRSSATSSLKRCSFRRVRYGSRQLGEAPMSLPFPYKCCRNFPRAIEKAPRQFPIAVDFIVARAPRLWGARFRSHHARLRQLVARVTAVGLLDLLQDPD